ncbi:hypothetical protein T03_1550 [Trichinella britovi]|uniref:Uncharacterized protein n=1 Tax=Trichinella britovi TaxID=45882 RepID=A0A0V1CD44_TRIBR|nr:hypothetical protein T03_1550 [Trichinella britovi]
MVFAYEFAYADNNNVPNANNPSKALKTDISKINTFTTSKSCFALSRSPCFATCVNRNHERKYQSPEAVNEILKNMYVDDLAFSIHEEVGF